MAKKSQLDKAIEALELDVHVHQTAINGLLSAMQALREQQKKAPVRKPQPRKRRDDGSYQNPRDMAILGGDPSL